MAISGPAVSTNYALSRREIAILAVIVAVGLALRLAWVLSVDTQLQAFSDPQWYYAVAANIADGHGATIVKTPFGSLPGAGGFETLKWPVGYPLTLAPLFRAFGESLTTAKVVNGLAGAATVPLAFVIARRLGDATTGLVAAGMMAVYPAHIIWSSVLYSDVLFTLPFAAAIAVVIVARPAPRPAIGLGVGLLIGYAMAIRPTAAVLLVAVVVYWWIRAPQRRATVAAAVTVFAGVLLIAAPIAAWNSVRSGSPKLLSENMGYNLRIGHAPYSTGRYVTPDDLWATVDGHADPSALPSESLAIRRAVRYAMSHPGNEVALSGKKVFYLYTTDSDATIWASTFGRTPFWGSAGAASRLGDVADIASWAVVLLALASLPRTLTLRREMLFAWLVLMLWTATHVVFFGEPRYRLPILPLLLTFAATSAVEIGRLARGSGASDTTSVDERNGSVAPTAT
jgi:4-amino-4-deoxy-L-arabinose transferase-like glycosyltransferase